MENNKKAQILALLPLFIIPLFGLGYIEFQKYQRENLAESLPQVEWSTQIEWAFQNGCIAGTKYNSNYDYGTKSRSWIMELGGFRNLSLLDMSIRETLHKPFDSKCCYITSAEPKFYQNMNIGGQEGCYSINSGLTMGG